jgi:hypothetical protein
LVHRSRSGQSCPLLGYILLLIWIALRRECEWWKQAYRLKLETDAAQLSSLVSVACLSEQRYPSSFLTKLQALLPMQQFDGKTTRCCGCR